ncbi:MAG: hypothetical protein AAF485_24045 [Chloroflexota bacterium]
MELAPLSNRFLTLEQATEFSVTLSQLLIGLLLPSIQGGHEFIIYLGLIPGLLAAFGLGWKDKWRWFYAALFLFSLLFALGPNTPIHRLFYNFVPGFGWVRTPARMFFVGGLAMAVLSGFGVEHLQRHRWTPQAKRWVIRVGIVVGLSFFLIGLGLMIGFAQINRATIAITFLLPIGIILIILRLHRTVSLTLTTSLLTLLLFLDLISFDLSMIRFIPSEAALSPGQATARYLASKPNLFRIYSPSYSLPAQTAASFNLQLADGVEPVHITRYDQFMARAGGYDDTSFSVTLPPFGDSPPDSAFEDVEPDLHLLGWLNVEYIVSAFPMSWAGLTLEREIEGTYIYQNNYARPRAWITTMTRNTGSDWLGQFAENKNGNSISIENGIHPIQTETEKITEPRLAKITHYSANLIKIQVENNVEGGSWLVLSEIWYPGWRATVNDIPQPVERVNGLLRGVFLTEGGTSEIEIFYQPATIVWGSWLTGVTSGGLILWGILAIIQHKRAGITTTNKLHRE